MRSNRTAVFTKILVMCLTIVQAQAMALGSADTAKSGSTVNSTSQQSPDKKSTREQNQELATPSFFLAPQHGTLVEVGASGADSTIKLSLNQALGGPIDLDNKSTARNYSLSLAQALTPNFALTASFTNSTTKADWETKVNGVSYQSNGEGNGMKDPRVGILGRMNFGQISILAGSDFLISTGDAESESQGSSSTTNQKRGGNAVEPSLAIFTNANDSAIFGARLTYSYNLDATNRNKQIFQSGASTITNTTIKGGNQMMALILSEQPLGNFCLGEAISYTRTEPSVRESTSMNSEMDASSLAIGMIYGDYRFNRVWSLMPALGYGQFLEKPSESAVDAQGKTVTDLNRYVITLAALNLRIQF